jgi:hypothetical protein|tara:strand:- start:106 stop:336 length:231 start_codon:yes stop_codon:yes gene_type:complete
MSNSNKSGFEIRADLLGQAQGILEGNLQRETEALLYNNDIAGKDMAICIDLSKQVIDTADVITTAKELYDFVNDKS